MSGAQARVRRARRLGLLAVTLLAGAAAARAAPGRAAESGAPHHLEPGAPRTSVPVLLVPGWLDSARDLAALRIHLLAAGWPDGYVETITFEEPTGSNRAHAEELEAAIATLLRETGADSVDIVAHSMGGLATRWYLLTRADAPVRRAVFIASPHRGTLSAWLAWGGGRDEMLPDSPFLDTLNSRAPAPTGVESITVRTMVDTHIVPGESATLPGVPDYVLCCPTHAGLLKDLDVMGVVRVWLEHGVIDRPEGGR